MTSKYIEKSSYWINLESDPDDPIGGHPSSTSLTIDFYDADGIELQTVQTTSIDIGQMDNLLPPPHLRIKPRPVTCKLMWFGAEGYKGVPGWFIGFYDVNGNKVQSFRYSPDSLTIFMYTPDGQLREFTFDLRKPYEISDKESFPLDIDRVSLEGPVDPWQPAARQHLCVVM